MYDATAAIRQRLLSSFPSAPHARPGWETATILVTVKAYPAVSKTAGEAVCVAGIRLDSPAPEWIRLFPVGFRALPRERQFVKYQAIRLNLTKGVTDRRPESWKPDLQSLEVGGALGTERGWRDRWELMGAFAGETTTCDLWRDSYSRGQAARSLGLVRPKDIADLIAADNPAYKPDAVKVVQTDLFGVEEPTLEATPFVVHYHYRCAAKACKGHKQTLVDWESGRLARRNVESTDLEEARRRHRAKFLDEMCSTSRDPYFYVGNQHQAPAGYLVLGLFWPPAQSNPRGLF